MRIRSLIAATVGAVLAVAAAPFNNKSRRAPVPAAAPQGSHGSKQQTTDMLPSGLRSRRPAPSVRRTGPDPKIVRMMQLQAGISAGMSRHTRRKLAQSFAKSMTAQAKADGVTVSMSRAEIRGRQKALASVIGGALVQAR